MIAYVTVGADDMARARRFYCAFLPALGYALSEGPEGLSFVPAAAPGQPRRSDFYVAYMRDPQGKKIALFSSKTETQGRDGEGAHGLRPCAGRRARPTNAKARPPGSRTGAAP